MSVKVKRLNDLSLGPFEVTQAKWFYASKRRFEFVQEIAPCDPVRSARTGLDAVIVTIPTRQILDALEKLGFVVSNRTGGHAP